MRRVRTFRIDTPFLLAADLVALMASLPAGAVIISMTSFGSGSGRYVLVEAESATFDEVPAYQVIPNSYVSIPYPDFAHAHEVLKNWKSDLMDKASGIKRPSTAPVTSTACICDMAYTGLRRHLGHCPQSPTKSTT